MSDMATEPRPRKIRVLEYHRMVEAGILHEGERVELVDGIIVEMSPLGAKHGGVHLLIVQYLTRALAGRAAVAGQMSIPLGDLSEPQPDVIILAPKEPEYVFRRPAAEELYAFIEIADSSLAYDTGRKRDLYATYGVREYLVVDVVASRLLRYTDPKDGRYRQMRELTYGDTFSLEALDRITLDAGALLPPPSGKPIA